MAIGRQRKRHAARQQFIKHNPQRVDIAGRLHRLTFGLFGRHILRRSYQLILRHSDRRCQTRDAEINNFDRAIRLDQDILRLDIAMNDLGGVRKAQGVADLRHERHNLSFQQGASAQALAQRHAVDKIHHQIELAIAAAVETVNRDNVGMVAQARPDLLAFGLELLHQVGVGCL